MPSKDRESKGRLTARIVVPAVLAALAAVAAATSPASAQPVTVGAKGGASIANISSAAEGLEDTNSRTGFVAGLFFDLELGRYFAIQPEVLFARKGFGVDVGEGPVDVELGAKLDYLEVPVLFKGLLRPPGSGVQPAVYAGGAVSFEAGCGLTGDIADFGGISFGCDGPGELELDRKKTDFSVVFGAGVDIDMKPVVVVLDVRYNLGLTNLDDSGEGDSAKSRAWYIMAGVGLPLQ